MHETAQVNTRDMVLQAFSECPNLLLSLNESIDRLSPNKPNPLLVAESAMIAIEFIGPAGRYGHAFTVVSMSGMWQFQGLRLASPKPCRAVHPALAVAPPGSLRRLSPTITPGQIRPGARAAAIEIGTNSNRLTAESLPDTIRPAILREIRRGRCLSGTGRTREVRLQQ